MKENFIKIMATNLDEITLAEKHLEDCLLEDINNNTLTSTERAGCIKGLVKLKAKRDVLLHIADSMELMQEILHFYA